MNRIAVSVIAAAAALAATVGPTQTAVAATVDAPDETRVIVTFEGETFDMASGWGTPESRPEIRACRVTEHRVDCYRSEAELQRATPTPATAQRAARCSSSLRLYDGTSYSGAVIYLTQRGSILPLSSYGFNNRTSSYRVGGCSSTFYNGIGSSPYPGNTSAWASAASMQPGWNNAISSVYIS